MSISEKPDNHSGSFRTTRWSIVLAAGATPNLESTDSLQVLCESYWYPLYAYARRTGHSAHDAEDRTQEFFANLLDHNFLDRASPERGRFRAYLLTAFKRFLATSFQREQALKRGGGRRVISLNSDEAEARLALDPASTSTPERVFEREWALSLLNRVLEMLRNEYSNRDRAFVFEKLKESLLGSEPKDYEALALATNMTAGAVRVTVHRLRQRYGELLRQEIEHTILDDDDFEGEYSSLLNALRSDR